MRRTSGACIALDGRLPGDRAQMQGKVQEASAITSKMNEAGTGGRGRSPGKDDRTVRGEADAVRTTIVVSHLWRVRDSLRLLVVTAALLGSAQLTAQWVTYPTPGVPQRADGKVNMAAPAPRLADGQPGFVGPVDDSGAQSGRRPRNRGSSTCPTRRATRETLRRRGRCGTSGSIFQGGCRISWLIPS